MCARCHFEKPKFVVEPPKSSIVISFSQPEPRNIPKSPVPIDETAHFDNLNPAQKIENGHIVTIYGDEIYFPNEDMGI